MIVFQVRSVMCKIILLLPKQHIHQSPFLMAMSQRTEIRDIDRPFESEEMETERKSFVRICLKRLEM